MKGMRVWDSGLNSIASVYFAAIAARAHTLAGTWFLREHIGCGATVA